MSGEVEAALARSPAVALLGPRQCGKTTLARQIAARHSECEFFDLEDPLDWQRLESPKLALEQLRGLVIIDEVQRRPELFSTLRVLIDQKEHDTKWLLLGSASPTIVKGVSESLAGRLAFVDMGGFRLDEVGGATWRTLWRRGGFPRSFLAADEAASYAWREDFVRTFLERDLPQLGLNVSATSMRRFWTMLAHYHGQVLNVAELARSMGISETSVRRYLDVLTGSFVVRQLQPWHANLKKRQVKSPKVYIRDTGLLHALLHLDDETALQRHPAVGASWEGFVIEQILRQHSERNAYFWATHGGAELDLLVFDDGAPVGFEVKLADVPRTTRSMRSAIEDLGMQQLTVVYPGERAFALDEGIAALPIAQLVDAKRHLLCR